MSSSSQSTQFNDTFPSHVTNVPNPNSGKLALSISGCGVDQTSVEVTERIITIGSADDCTISLCPEQIPPHALRITRGRHRSFVYALCPETQLNGQTFTRDWLTEGDRIDCGSYEVQVLSVDPFMMETLESEAAVQTGCVQTAGIREEELRRLKEHTAELRAKLEQQRQQLLEGNHEVEADLRESLDHLRKSRERLITLTVEAQPAPEQTAIATTSTLEQITPNIPDYTSVSQTSETITETSAGCCGNKQCDSPCEQPATRKCEVEQYNLLSETASTETDASDQSECEVTDQPENEGNRLFECEVVDVPVEVATDSLKEWFNTDADSAEEPAAILADIIVEEDSKVAQVFETVTAFNATDSCDWTVEVDENYQHESLVEAVEETEQTECESELFDEIAAEANSLEAIEAIEATEAIEPVEAQVETNEDADTAAKNSESVEATPTDPPKSTLPQHVLDIIRAHQRELEAAQPQETVQEIETQEIESAEVPVPHSKLVEADEFTATSTDNLEVSEELNADTDATQVYESNTDDLEVERLLMEVIREHESSQSKEDKEEECAGESFFSHIDSEADQAEARINQRLQLPTFTSIRDGLSNFFGNSKSNDNPVTQEFTTKDATQEVASDEVSEDDVLASESFVLNESLPIEKTVNEEPVSLDEQALQTDELILEQVVEQPTTPDNVPTQDAPVNASIDLSRIEQRLSEQRGSIMESFETRATAKNAHETNRLEPANFETASAEIGVATEAAESVTCQADAVEPNAQVETEQDTIPEPQSLTYEQLKQSMLDDSCTNSELSGSATQPPSEPQVTQEVTLSAVSETAKEVEAEEESVEAYMQRLLNRNGVSKQPAPPKPATPALTKVEEKVEVEIKSVLKETFSEQLANRQEELKPVEISPKSLPKLESNYLDEMRNMSRESAKSAIEASYRRKTSTAATVQLGLAVCCFLGGLIQTVLAKGFSTTAALMAIPFYIVAAVLFYRYNNWRRACHKVGGTGAIKVEPKNPKKESSRKKSSRKEK